MILNYVLLIISPKKLNHTLKPVTMTSRYNKVEKKLLIHNMRDQEREMDCYCFKDEVSMIGKLFWVVGLFMALGICTSMILSVRIVREKRNLHTLKNSTDSNKVWYVMVQLETTVEWSRDKQDCSWKEAHGRVSEAVAVKRKWTVYCRTSCPDRKYLFSFENYYLFFQLRSQNLRHS